MDHAHRETIPVAVCRADVAPLGVRAINVLEHQIASAETEADSLLWDQARQVVAALEQMSQRELAEQWLNPNGEPYSAMHVNRTAKAFKCNVNVTPRPRFRDAYNKIANASKLAVHHSSESPEHYTPSAFLGLVAAVFGDVPDLDPCSNSHKSPNVPARRHYTQADDGLKRPWTGRVFVNPPYGREIADWSKKIRAEWQRGEVIELIALVPARTDTDWFETLTVDTDDAIVCLLRGRLTFVGNNDPAPFPSLVVYFGPKHDRFAAVFMPHGSLWQRPSRPLEWFVCHDEEPC